MMTATLTKMNQLRKLNGWKGKEIEKDENGKRDKPKNVQPKFSE